MKQVTPRSAVARRREKADVLYKRAYELRDQGDPRSAFRLFLAAAKLGDEISQQMVGYSYDLGEGVRRNKRLAIQWYKKSYRQGSPFSASNIANIYRAQGNISSAITWYERAIRLRDGDASLEVAKIYLEVKNDPAKAMPYLRRALRARDADITGDGRRAAARLLRQIAPTKKAQRMSRGRIKDAAV